MMPQTINECVCKTFFNYAALKGTTIAACNRHFGLLASEQVETNGNEKELGDADAKIWCFYSFPTTHIKDYIHHSNPNWDGKTLESLKDYFQGRLSQMNFTKNHLSWQQGSILSLLKQQELKSCSLPINQTLFFMRFLALVVDVTIHHLLFVMHVWTNCTICNPTTSIQWPWTLMQCTKLSIPLVHVLKPPSPLEVKLSQKNALEIKTLITLMITSGPQVIEVTLVVAPAVVITVMIADVTAAKQPTRWPLWTAFPLFQYVILTFTTLQVPQSLQHPYNECMPTGDMSPSH